MIEKTAKDGQTGQNKTWGKKKRQISSKWYWDSNYFAILVMPFHADLGIAFWWATLPIYGEPSQKNHCCEWNDLFSQKLAVKFSSDEKRKGKKYKLSIFSSPRFSILPAKTIWGWNAISENISDLVLAVFLRHVYQSSWWVSILDIGSARRCPSFKAGYFLTAAFSARIPKSLTSLHEQWASNSSTSKVFHCFGLFGIYNFSWQTYNSCFIFKMCVL